MKKIILPAVLLMLAAAAIVAAAYTKHSRANRHYPNEWEHSFFAGITGTSQSQVVKQHL